MPHEHKQESQIDCAFQSADVKLVAGEELRRAIEAERRARLNYLKARKLLQRQFQLTCATCANPQDMARLLALSFDILAAMTIE